MKSFKRKEIQECHMKTFVEIFIEYIDELTTNWQLYENVFINFQKSNGTIYIVNEISQMNKI